MYFIHHMGRLCMKWLKHGCQMTQMKFRLGWDSTSTTNTCHWLTYEIEIVFILLKYFYFYLGHFFHFSSNLLLKGPALSRSYNTFLKQVFVWKHWELNQFYWGPIKKRQVFGWHILILVLRVQRPAYDAATDFVIFKDKFYFLSLAKKNMFELVSCSVH